MIQSKFYLILCYVGLIIILGVHCSQKKSPISFVTASQILGNKAYPAISYGGYRHDTRAIAPTIDEIKEDMRLLEAMGIKLIRTYNTQLFEETSRLLEAISLMKKEDPAFEMSYRKKLGVVLQDDFLFEGSIKDNILFSKPNASKKQLDDAVIAASVNEFTDRFEDGIDTLIGERGVKLSGGQRQRITIARAIIADPRILILDEATSNLDNESESLIQESLKKLMKGRTTFVIAHRLSTIRQADQILVIENGKIAEKGTHEKLLSLEGRYYNLHKYQARI